MKKRSAANKSNINYPSEVHELAYALHSRGLSRAEIQAQLHNYCKKNLKRPGPLVRTLDQWRVNDDWEGQDEILKVNLRKELRSKLLKKKEEIFENVSEVADTTLEHFREQAKDGIKVPANQAVYALPNLYRFLMDYIDKDDPGTDMDKIVRSLGTLMVEKFEKVVLKRAMTEHEQAEFYEALKQELQHG